MYLFLITLTGIIAYSNTFDVPFQFDDFEEIEKNPVIGSLEDFLSDKKGYEYNPRRFIGYLTFALNYRFGGLDVTGYHIVNLAIHIINAMLVYFLVLLTLRTPYFGNGQSAIGNNHASRFTSHVSRFTLHDSRLTSHDSRFTIHHSRFFALLVALLFVSHPVQTQAVTYIVQRLTSLATMFYLLSVVLYIKGRLWARGNRQGAIAYRLLPIAYYFFSLFSALLAMKTKEIAFTLPVVVILYEFMFLGRFDVRGYRQEAMGKEQRLGAMGNGQWVKDEVKPIAYRLLPKLLFLIPVVLTLAIIPLSIIGVDKPLGEIISDVSERTRVQTAIPRWDYLMTELRVIVTYIRLIFFPINQNLDYDYPVYGSLFTPPVFLSFLFLLSIFGIAVYLLYRSGRKAMGNRQWATGNGQWVKAPIAYSLSPIACCLSPIAHYRLIAFGIFWFFITLSVESSFIPIVDVIFEHRVYLPSVGAFIAITAAIVLLVSRFLHPLPSPCLPDRQAPPLMGRDSDLRSGDTQLRVSTPPKKFPLPWREGIKGRGISIALLTASLAIIVALTSATYARNTVWQDTARLWEDVVKKSPHKARGHNDLGFVYLGRGMTDRAVRQFMIALQLNPRDVDAFNNLGVAYYGKGQFDIAIEHFRTATRLASSKPEHSDSHHNLGIAYVRKGMLPEALAEMQSSLKYAPDNPEIYSDMGVVYKEMGETDKAIESYSSALSLKPDYAPAHFNLGMIYKEKGLRAEAVEHLRRAHNLDPGRF